MQRTNEIPVGYDPTQLHGHSPWSDGAHAIPEIVQAAREQGIRRLAVTDHNAWMQNLELWRATAEHNARVPLVSWEVFPIAGTEVTLNKAGDVVLLHEPADGNLNPDVLDFFKYAIRWRHAYTLPQLIKDAVKHHGIVSYIVHPDIRGPLVYSVPLSDILALSGVLTDEEMSHVVVEACNHSAICLPGNSFREENLYDALVNGSGQRGGRFALASSADYHNKSSVGKYPVMIPSAMGLRQAVKERALTPILEEQTIFQFGLDIGRAAVEMTRASIRYHW